MFSNPFKFGKEVAGKYFYDREEVFLSLYRKLAGGSSNVVMYAPRRYGKTSLVKKVLARFSEEGVPTVYFDLNKADSLEHFCEEYASALYAVAGKGSAALDAIGKYLSHLHPTIGVGGDALVSLRLDFGAKMTATSLAEVLDLAERISSEVVRKPIVVAFDEFQEIGRLSREIPPEGVFRSCIQSHQNVRYLFLGSKTHMLRRMFGDKARPFYKSAATVRLAKPPEDESLAFVKERFASRSIGVDDEEARRIVSESDNIPYYLQQLSSLVFDEVAAAGRDWVEKTDVDVAIGSLIAENADYYQERVSLLSPAQRLVVSALAREPVADFDEDYRMRHSLGGSSTVHSALRAVVNAGIVEREGRTYAIGDPFLAKYLNESPTEVTK
ncbi:MAG: ATP-binding protein [Kiritimatiellae bacterium]|nr:ATP-binding protein [Kiritimatiellia bacterium]